MNWEQRCTGDEDGERLLRASKDREVTGEKIDLFRTVLVTWECYQHDAIRTIKPLASL